MTTKAILILKHNYMDRFHCCKGWLEDVTSMLYRHLLATSVTAI